MPSAPRDRRPAQADDEADHADEVLDETRARELAIWRAAYEERYGRPPPDDGPDD